MIDAARAAGIVDATGQPLDARLRAASRPRVLVVDATDGDPAVGSARRGAAANPDRRIAGLRAAAEATGATRAVVAVERRAGEVARALAAVPVHLVDDLAGCGDPADLAWDVTGRHDGVLVLDAASIVALGAALGGEPVIERVVTVAGSVARPGVGLVPVGTTVEDLVAAAGGTTCGAGWMALGDGPLAGRPLDRDDVVTKGTRAIFVGAAGSDLVRRARLSVADSVRRSLSACERCAMCTDACPPRLLGGRLRPDELVRALGAPATAQAELVAALECTACGLCDVACPSGLSPRALVTAAARALVDRDVGSSPAERGHPHEARAHRRLGVGLVARRLGLGDGPLELPWEHWSIPPATVVLPLKMSLGHAARPLVRAGDRVLRGQLVGDVPEGAVGARLHASIGGIVDAITGGAIAIRPA